MPARVDPMDALNSFQREMLMGTMRIEKCELDKSLFVHLDQPGKGLKRLTYVRLNGNTVTALALFVSTEPLEGLPCFQAGVAVPEKYRQQGRAKSVIAAAIAELKNGFKQHMPCFYVEAVVSKENVASQRVASETISSNPVSIMDHFTREPSLQYLLKIGQ